MPREGIISLLPVEVLQDVLTVMQMRIHMPTFLVMMRVRRHVLRVVLRSVMLRVAVGLVAAVMMLRHFSISYLLIRRCGHGCGPWMHSHRRDDADASQHDRRAPS